MPVVAHTVAVFGERPIANAFGIDGLGDRHPRLGQVGLDAQPLDDRVELAAPPAGVTSWAPIESSAILSEVKNWTRNRTAGDHRDRHRAGAGGDQHADQDGVDEPEQEQRQQHPGLEPGIAAE